MPRMIDTDPTQTARTGRRVKDRLTADASASSSLWPVARRTILAEYGSLPENLPIELVLGGRGEQAPAVREGRADVALLLTPYDGRGLDAEDLLIEPLPVALSASDPLAAHHRLRLADLAGRSLPDGTPADLDGPPLAERTAAGTAAAGAGRGQPEPPAVLQGPLAPRVQGGHLTICRGKNPVASPQRGWKAELAVARSAAPCSPLRAPWGMSGQGPLPGQHPRPPSLGSPAPWPSEVGDEGVTVNAVRPSFVETPGNAERWDSSGFVVQGQIIHRPGEVHDVTGLVSFLASDAAAYVTGQMINADRGLVLR